MHFHEAHKPGDEHNCCGCATVGQATEQARFPDACKTDVLIIIDKDSPSRGWPGTAVMGIAYEQFFMLFDKACQSWNKAVGIRLRVTDDRQQFPSAICKVVFWEFGGGVLADSHLADGTCTDDKRQRYDHRRWSEHLLFLTILHELGHLIGLHHKSGPYIMNPSILTGLTGLTADDISRGRNLGYGLPLDAPEEPEEPEDPEEPQPPTPQPPEEKMNWVDLIVKLLPVILDCINNEGETAVFARLRRGGFRQSMAIWREARRQGLRGKAAREQVQAVNADLAAMSDTELREVLQMGKEASSE